MKNLTNKKNGGYAILFAVVVVSVISIIAVGLSNSTFKQLILSSVARDSQTSFFESDTATECALYADAVLNLTSGTPSPWLCGVDANGRNYSFDISPLSSGGNGYEVRPSAPDASPCFEFGVEKLIPVNPGDPSTKVRGRGYNSCDKNSPKTVEREIQVTY